MVLKNNRGISLVTLAITIAVITILTGAVVAVTLKDDGIIGNTKAAKESVEKSAVYQDIVQSIVTSKNKNGKINEDMLKNKLQKVDESVSLVYDESTSSYTVTIKEKTYIIEEYGNITEQE